MKCPYCDKEALWCENKEIYGRNYGNSYMVYLCKPCNAYVGCHQNTKKPLGIMANAELREWKKKAHSLFDPLWRNGKMKRGQAYKWLSDLMKIPVHEAHIGMFDIDKCKKLIKLIQ